MKPQLVKNKIKIQSVIKRYSFPKYLVGLCDPKVFEKWLNRKTLAHVKRDRKRGFVSKKESYKSAIYNAVIESKGLDAYTGKMLRWDLISKWDNIVSSEDGRNYKKKFKDLPTLDHVYDDQGKVVFKICSWRINDCKSDLDLEEFINLCHDVLAYHEHLTSNKEHPEVKIDTDEK